MSGFGDRWGSRFLVEVLGLPISDGVWSFEAVLYECFLQPSLSVGPNPLLEALKLYWASSESGATVAQTTGNDDSILPCGLMGPRQQSRV